jgi:hypothetical protein
MLMTMAIEEFANGVIQMVRQKKDSTRSASPIRMKALKSP